MPVIGFEQSRRRHTEPVGDLQQRQHPGVASSVLDIDQPTKAEVTEVGKLLQTQIPMLSQGSDAQTQRQQPWVGRIAV